MATGSLLERLFSHERLSRQAAYQLMNGMADGQANEHQVAAVLTALRMRPMALEEVQGFRDALLERCIDPGLNAEDAVDLCGTGGDGKDTFNISTLAAFVVAGAGYPVVKHGNYGVSSSCGSSNVLEAMGLRFSAEPAELRRQLAEAGICFLHAPLFHPALARMAPVRKALGVKTLFNVLGPLVNPAQPGHQLAGVFQLELVRIYQYVLEEADRAFCIVHSLDGYDELALTAAARLVGRDGPKDVDARTLGMASCSPEALRGGKDIPESAALFRRVLEGEGTAAQVRVVLANAALAIGTYHPGRPFSENLKEAQRALEQGAARNAFQRLLTVQGAPSSERPALEANREQSADRHPGRGAAKGSVQGLEAILQKCRVNLVQTKRQRPLALVQEAANGQGPTRGFEGALRKQAPGIIAEFKRRSPSASVISPPNSVPELVALGYQNAGAAALSVLTNGPHFGGSLEDLQAVRAACDLPVLRKDFVLEPYQVWEARAAGADAILLIAEALDRAALLECHTLARRLGMDVLVEVHSAEVLDRVPEDVRLLGINHRNLKDFSINLDLGLKLLPMLQARFPQALLVAESGLREAAQAVQLAEGGFEAFLVGSHFLQSASPEAECREFVNQLQRSRVFMVNTKA